MNIQDMTEDQVMELRVRIFNQAVLDVAQAIYNAYGEDAEWKNYKGDPMPQWNDLPANIVRHWIAVVNKVMVVKL